jgi:hypothetical protein
MKNKIIYFGNIGQNFVKIKLSLGDNLAVRYGRKTLNNCVFVKVTRKGFNILDLNSSRTILKHHIYAIGMASKEYEKSGGITKDFFVPEYCQILKIKNEKENVG